MRCCRSTRTLMHGQLLSRTQRFTSPARQHPLRFQRRPFSRPTARSWGTPLSQRSLGNASVWAMASARSRRCQSYPDRGNGLGNEAVLHRNRGCRARSSHGARRAQVAARGSVSELRRRRVRSLGTPCAARALDRPLSHDCASAGIPRRSPLSRTWKRSSDVRYP